MAAVPDEFPQRPPRAEPPRVGREEGPGVDPERRRLSLSLKRVTPAPEGYEPPVSAYDEPDVNLEGEGEPEA